MGVAAFADAWLATAFFYKKKKKYFYGPRECPDCGTLLASSVVARHRRFNCKSRQPVALGSVQQGWPAEKDAALIERSVDLPLKDG